MVTIKPFRPLKPKSKFAGSVAAPPYDSVSVEEAQEILWKNPHSFISVLKPEVNVPPYVTDRAKIYDEARALLVEYLEKGIFYQERVPSLYVYRESFAGRSQCGIVGLFSCKDFSEGRIRATEKTKDEELEGRIRWIESLGVQAGPVFLIHRESFRIRRAVNRILKGVPEYDFFTDDAVRHTVFRVSAPSQVEYLQNLFLRVPRLYVADGNHRIKAACLHNPDGYFPGAAVSAGDARTFSYERLVRFPEGFPGFSGFSGGGVPLINMLKKFFAVSRLDSSPEENFFAKLVRRRSLQAHTIVMYLKVREKGIVRYLLTPLPLVEKEFHTLPAVSVLSKVVFKRILRMDREEKWVEYVSECAGKCLEEKLAKGNFDAAFSVSALSPFDVMRFADSGVILPPKSVWFYPKFRSGLFLNPLRDFSDLLSRGKGSGDADDEYSIWF